MDKAKRERDERMTAKCPKAMGGGRKRERRITVINNTRCNCTGPAPWPRAVDCRRLTEERWRKRGEEREERTKEGQGDGWMEQPSA